MASVGQRMAKYSAMIFLTSILVKGMSMITAIVVARLLGPENLGILGIVDNLNGIFTTVSGFGMALAVVRVLPEYRTSDPAKVNRTLATYFWLTLAATLPVVAVYFVLSPYLSINLYGEPRLTFLFYLSIIGIVIGMLGAVFGPVMQAYQKIPLMTKLNILFGGAGLGLDIALIYVFRLEGAFYAGIASGLIGLMAFCLVFRSQIVARLHVLFTFDKKIAKYLAFFGGPTFFGSLLAVLGSWYGVTILQRYGDFNDVGFFRVASTVATMIMFIPSAIVVPFLPIITELFARDEKEFERVYFTALKYVIVICLPISIGASLFSHTVISILFSSAYLDAAGLVVIMASYAFLFSYIAVYGWIVYVTNYMKGLIIANTIWFGIILTLTTILVPMYLAYGLVIATFGTFSFHIFTGTLIAMRKYKNKRLLKYGIVASLLSFMVLLSGIFGLRVEFIWKIPIYLAFLGGYVLMLNRFILTDRDKKYLLGLVGIARRGVT